MQPLNQYDILQAPSPMETSVLDCFIEAFRDNIERMSRDDMPALQPLSYWEDDLRQTVLDEQGQSYSGWRIQLFKIGSRVHRAIAMHALRHGENLAMLRTYCVTHCSDDELPLIIKNYHSIVVRYMVERGVSLNFEQYVL